MKNKLIIFHGSDHIIEKPEYGKGKIYNDYGRGFYCTEYLELAKEWACGDNRDGYAIKYEVDTDELNILDLSDEKYCVLHWISLLLKNRKFTLDNDISVQSKEYILNNFDVDVSNYDIIKGYRADDSYFSYARDFLQNTISVRRLKDVMKLGNLGNQIVLISQKSFEKIQFLGYEKVDKKIYFPLRQKRDEFARLSYFGNKEGKSVTEDIYMIDVIRNEMKANDLRLQ